MTAMIDSGDYDDGDDAAGYYIADYAEDDDDDGCADAGVDDGDCGYGGDAGWWL